MSYRCSDGHESSDPDYCSVCGAPVTAAPSAPPNVSPPPPGGAGSAPVSIAATQPCPNCGTDNEADVLFCESCGYDFTTGSLPPAADPGIVAVPPSTSTPAPSGSGHPRPGVASTPPAASSWVAEVWIDPEWYAVQQDPSDPCPTSGAPRVVVLPVAGALIGRPSSRQHLEPELDCSPDSAVSRRHAQLSLANDRWYLEDLGSTNGTFVARVADPLPATPLRQRHELADDERIYVGAWTRIQLRRGTAAERGSGA